MVPEKTQAAGTIVHDMHDTKLTKEVWNVQKIHKKIKTADYTK